MYFPFDGLASEPSIGAPFRVANYPFRRAPETPIDQFARQLLGLLRATLPFIGRTSPAGSASSTRRSGSFADIFTGRMTWTYHLPRCRLEGSGLR